MSSAYIGSSWLGGCLGCDMSESANGYGQSRTLHRRDVEFCLTGNSRRRDLPLKHLGNIYYSSTLCLFQNV
jgi:coenzyme F420-reducing hydrogenase gamma subunit